MARGFPDWRPPQASVRVSLAHIATSVAADLIASPGAGNRLSIYALWLVNPAAASAGADISEVTPANALVQQLDEFALTQFATSPQHLYFGLPLGENNKVRQLAGVGATVDIFALYTIEAV